MSSNIPPSIALSLLQQNMLHLIIEDQATVKRSAEPENVILLWAEGVSITQTARQLRIRRNDVRLIRQRWWDSQARVSAAEKRLFAAFRNLSTRIFRIPTEETPTKFDVTVRKNVSEATELRPAARALIEILHHKPKHYGINRSNWSHASLADALESDWRSLARPEQLAPEGDWSTWLILAGRGAGKTRSGAEWVRSIAEAAQVARLAGC